MDFYETCVPKIDRFRQSSRFFGSASVKPYQIEAAITVYAAKRTSRQINPFFAAKYKRNLWFVVTHPVGHLETASRFADMQRSIAACNSSFDEKTRASLRSKWDR